MINQLNAIAWDEEVRKNNYWTRIVGKKEIERARKGDVRIRITPTRYVPLSWLDGMKGKKVLLLASAGGQQTAILAAYGCTVTSIDISALQIEQDRKALKMYGLEAETVVSDMRDLSSYSDSSFSAVIIPHSLNFIEETESLYSQVSRVLEKGGAFLFGVANPVLYLFDEKKEEKGKLKVKYTIPFSDEKSKSEKEKMRMIRKKDTFEYSHTLSSLLSPLFRNFILKDFYSDESGNETVDSFIHDSFLAFFFIRA